MDPSSPDNNAAIGVFDSGIGGLTVVKELMAAFPDERIIYFGDTARIPYGTKSVETVKRFSLEDCMFLLDQQVKLIVVACNTASAVAIPFLKKIVPVPLVGMIEPGAAAAARLPPGGRIGVIGTAATIRSQAYRKELEQYGKGHQLIAQACPLFVPLVEEGWVDEEACRLIAGRYLQPMLDNHVQALILGCTHYPLLAATITAIVGERVLLIDSGVEAAKTVGSILDKNGLRARLDAPPTHRFYLSDLPHKFQEIGERFLERNLPHVQTLNFEAFILSKGRKFWKAYEEELMRP